MIKIRTLPKCLLLQRQTLVPLVKTNDPFSSCPTFATGSDEIETSVTVCQIYTCNASAPKSAMHTVAEFSGTQVRQAKTVISFCQLKRNPSPSKTTPITEVYSKDSISHYMSFIFWL